MGSGWHEWPLVIFTVFGQCVAGALIVTGFVWLKENDDKARMRIVRSLFFLWLVMGIGDITRPPFSVGYLPAEPGVRNGVWLLPESQ